jgi:hypothetical protein
MNLDVAKRLVTRWYAVPAVVAAVALVVVAAVVVLRGPARNTAGLANQQPPKLPSAQPRTPKTVTAPDGSRITCPDGLEPGVNLDEAAFSPALSDGVSLKPGTYRLKLRGMVENETTEPINVTSVAVLVGDVAWDAPVTVATSVAAHGRADLVVEGTYQSTRSQAAYVHAHLSWEWQKAALRPCGTAGLIEEH